MARDAGPSGSSRRSTPGGRSWCPTRTGRARGPCCWTARPSRTSTWTTRPTWSSSTSGGWPPPSTCSPPPARRCGCCTWAAARSPCPATSRPPGPAPASGSPRSTAALVDLVRRVLPWRPDPGCGSGSADARDRAPPARDAAYDLVVADVFAGARTPAHLTSVEFAGEVARVLQPGAAATWPTSPTGRRCGTPAAQVATSARCCPGPAWSPTRRCCAAGGTATWCWSPGGTEPPVAELTRRAAGDWFPGRVLADDRAGPVRRRGAGRAGRHRPTVHAAACRNFRCQRVDPTGPGHPYHWCGAWSAGPGDRLRRVAADACVGRPVGSGDGRQDVRNTAVRRSIDEWKTLDGRAAGAPMMGR